MKTPVYQLSSLNLKLNPLLLQEGQMIRSLNVDSFPLGAKTKRSGYGTYLGTMPNGSVVQDLANFTRNNGTQFWNYAYAGGLLYSSQQGTGAWTITGGGTFSAAGTLCAAVSNDTFFISDGVGTIVSSTDGTSFAAVAAAPIAVGLQHFQDRLYAAGTAQFVAYSNVGTPTDWVNNSSNFTAGGGGKLLTLFKSNDYLVAPKNVGDLFAWDGYNLTDMSTDYGPTSSRSIAALEDYRVYLNRLGFWGALGAEKPKLLSNAIERQIYNKANGGIIGTTFNNAPAVAHQLKYYCTIGTVTDDLTSQTIPDAVAVYDYQQNEWGNYQYANRPTAYLSFRDENGVQQMIFGGGSQVYQVQGTATTDNGVAIESAQEYVITAGQPESDKKWNYIWLFFNPGCEATVSVAYANTFTKASKQWISLGDAKDGVVEFKFSGARSKFLFLKITDNSKDARYTFYGYTIDADIIDRT